MVTGPATKNMREALQRTYNATPDPKWVVAVGDCAANGGIFADSYAVVGGIHNVVPVDLHIGGCPPRPAQLLADCWRCSNAECCVALRFGKPQPDQPVERGLIGEQCRRRA